jgi:single-strand DNA-binding protein
MNNLVNKVQLIGRLGMNPEVRTFENKNTMVRMSLATDASYRNTEGKKVQEAHWHTLVAWGNTAKIAEKYLKKGKEIAVLGKLVNRNYTDKDGNKRNATEVHVNEFKLLSGKEE